METIAGNRSPFPVDRRGRGECAIELLVLIALAAFGTSVAHGVLFCLIYNRYCNRLRLKAD